MAFIIRVKRTRPSAYPALTLPWWYLTDEWEIETRVRDEAARFKTRYAAKKRISDQREVEAVRGTQRDQDKIIEVQK
jgi:hypothetical protein